MHIPWKTIGHDRQKQEIEKNISEDNLAHAYLFSGPKDIGKLYFAKEVGRSLLCQNNLCGTCSDCRQIENLTHSDFLILDMLYIDKVHTDWEEIAKFSNVPQEIRATGNKAKSDKIGIATIRSLQTKLQEKSLGKYKVCIIHNIDRITIEATNAFLKTVEEPPQGVIFIFTTSKESALLPTIISRTRIVRFNTLHNNIIKEKVLEKFPDTKDLETILQFAQGRIGVALHLARVPEDKKQLEEDYKKIREVYEDMPLRKQFAFVEQISENSQDLQKFFEHSYYYLRSLLDQDRSDIVEKLEQLEKTEKLIGQNINKKLALENFFLSNTP